MNIETTEQKENGQRILSNITYISLKLLLQKVTMSNFENITV